MGQPTTFVRQLRSRFLRQDAAGAADAALLDGYLDRRDEAAFEALVRRHGPMVLGVCRRILGSTADADDAFQATFLVLVRKAATVRPRSMVGNWLYGVACRTARAARRAAVKRRAKEAAVVPRTPSPEADRSDLRAALDAELERLPAKARAVLVLSDLEGKTRAEVARQLGWPEGTVASRLGRARAKLAGRLARHAFAVSAGSLGAVLSGEAAAVPGPLLAATVDAARLLAAGPAAAALIPAQVVALTEGALKAMLLKKVASAAALVLVVGALGTGTGLVLLPAGGTEGSGRSGAPPDRTAAGRNGAPAVAGRGPGAAREGDAAKELDRLKGVWACVGYERDGEEHADAQARDAMWNETLWFRGTTPGDERLNLSWERPGRQTSAAAVFQLRPATTPRGIDLTWKSIPAREYMPDGIDPAWEGATRDERKLDRAQPGVYSFDGDRLRVCWGELGGDRPASTKTKRGDKWTTHLYERKKE